VDRDITIADLNVKLLLSYPTLPDLYVHLRGPDGTDVVLINRDVRGNNMASTVFDDGAATSIRSGSAPYTGTFRPDGALSAFNGKDARGTWQLIIEDRGGNGGLLHYYTLTITGVVAGVTRATVDESGTPQDATASQVPTVATAAFQGSTAASAAGAEQGLDFSLAGFDLGDHEQAALPVGGFAAPATQATVVPTRSEAPTRTTQEATDLLFSSGGGQEDVAAADLLTYFDHLVADDGI
jgi:subtilisin-like proprotein convertase family protein